MDQFKKTVLMIALSIFLGMLLIMAIIIKNSYKNKIFPPDVAQCPDYWNPVEGSRKCKATANNKGTFSQGTESQELANNTATGRIENCNWARDNKVTWDGITNLNLC
tara:strand:- start:1576 stop:1896 length:321 start_codon:yes stop_codon:yes gene_type:complete